MKDVLRKPFLAILSWCAGSVWIVQPALGAAPKLQEVARRRLRTRDLIMWGIKPEGYEGPTRWNHVKLIETEYKPPYPNLPARPFVMACRPLCGLDLHRPHVTCFALCRIRKAFYGKIPKVAELQEVWTIPRIKAMYRRNGILKDRIFKRVSLAAEICST